MWHFWAWTLVISERPFRASSFPSGMVNNIWHGSAPQTWIPTYLGWTKGSTYPWWIWAWSRNKSVLLKPLRSGNCLYQKTQTILIITIGNKDGSKGQAELGTLSQFPSPLYHFSTFLSLALHLTAKWLPAVPGSQSPSLCQLKGTNFLPHLWVRKPWGRALIVTSTLLSSKERLGIVVREDRMAYLQNGWVTFPGQKNSLGSENNGPPLQVTVNLLYISLPF